MLLLIEVMIINLSFIMMHLFEGFAMFVNTYIVSPQKSEEDCFYDTQIAEVVTHETFDTSYEKDSYEVSLITDEQQGFLDELTSMFNPIIEDIDNAIDEGLDILKVDTWTDKIEPVEINFEVTASPDAKISDFQFGEQTWFVEVVGEEEGYLHVSDGSGRTWINSNGFGNFRRKDILSVRIERDEENRAILLAADLLQSYSQDFDMADAIDYENELNYTDSYKNLEFETA